MKCSNDRLNAAHEQLRELTSFMSAGIYVPHYLVQQAHRVLLHELRQARRTALQRRRKRKVKRDVEDV
jgi:hypothetical protein